MSSLSNHPHRRTVIGAFAAMPVVPSLFRLFGSTAHAQTQQTQMSAGKGFSFAAYGDSRPMMYLPSKEGNPDLTQLFVEMFGLVMPEKIAEEVVKRDVKVTFDPVTHELIQIVMPFESKTEVMTLTVDQGWVTEALVEDVKLLPGVHRTMFRLQGGDWVAREIVGHVQSGRAEFVVSSGDVVWWGNQGLTVTDSPYWKRVSDTMLKLLPPPDKTILDAGLRAVPSAAFANAIIILYLITALLGAVVYLYFKVHIQPDLQRDRHWTALGLLDLKEDFLAVRLGVLPAYWVCWRRPLGDERGWARAALTAVLAFIVWWSFLVG